MKRLGTRGREGGRKKKKEKRENATPGMHTQQTVNKEEIKQGTTGHSSDDFS